MQIMLISKPFKLGIVKNKWYSFHSKKGDKIYDKPDDFKFEIRVYILQLIRIPRVSSNFRDAQL